MRFARKSTEHTTHDPGPDRDRGARCTLLQPTSLSAKQHAPPGTGGASLGASLSRRSTALGTPTYNTNNEQRIRNNDDKHPTLHFAGWLRGVGCSFRRAQGASASASASAPRPHSTTTDVSHPPRTSKFQLPQWLLPDNCPAGKSLPYLGRQASSSDAGAKPAELVVKELACRELQPVHAVHAARRAATAAATRAHMPL